MGKALGKRRTKSQKSPCDCSLKHCHPVSRDRSCGTGYLVKTALTIRPLTASTLAKLTS